MRRAVREQTNFNQSTGATSAPSVNLVLSIVDFYYTQISRYVGDNITVGKFNTAMSIPVV